MNKIKKLILGSALFLGLGAVSTSALEPLPITFLNYQWTNNVKGIKSGSSLESGSSQISVKMINTATGQPVTDLLTNPQVFTYYSDAEWKLMSATERQAAYRFQANDYGLLYFRFDMTGIMDISHVSANYKLEISVVSASGNKISGYLSVLDVIRNYYQAGNGFETIANANTEAIQQAAGVVTGVAPEDGDIQYGKSGGFTNLHKGADGQVLKLDNGMPVWSSVFNITESNTFGSTANATTIAGDLKFQSTQNAANTSNKAVTTIAEPNTTADYTLTLPTNTGTLVAAEGAAENGKVLKSVNGVPTWDNEATGIPTGGTTGQVLTQTASGPAWSNAPKTTLANAYDGTTATNNAIEVTSAGGPVKINTAVVGNLANQPSGLEVNATGSDSRGIYAKGGIHGIVGESNGGNGVYGKSGSGTGVIGISNYIGVSASGGLVGIMTSSQNGTALQVAGTTKFVSTGTESAGTYYYNNVVIAKPAALATGATADVNTNLTLPTNSGALVAAATAPTANDDGKVLTVSSTGTPTWSDAPASQAVASVVSNGTTNVVFTGTPTAGTIRIVILSAAPTTNVTIYGTNTIAAAGTYIFVYNGSAWKYSAMN